MTRLVLSLMKKLDYNPSVKQIKVMEWTIRIQKVPFSVQLAINNENVEYCRIVISNEYEKPKVHEYP